MLDITTNLVMAVFLIAAAAYLGGIHVVTNDSGKKRISIKRPWTLTMFATSMLFLLLFVGLLEI